MTLGLSNGPSSAQLGLSNWSMGSNGRSIIDNGPNKCPMLIETMSKWACPWTPIVLITINL